MKLGFRLLLLAALVVLVMAGSVAAREETKRQDSDESTDLQADGEKSKKQKDDTQLDSEKARVKQKWQRYKPPSSKKAKKAALRKEKAMAKSGKEKWKAAAEEAREKKAKRSAQYLERDAASRRKLTKDKSWKESKEKSLQAERRTSSGEGKKLDVDKLKQGSKVTEKQAQKEKWKSSEDTSACAKDELCSSGSDENVPGEKKKWKKKNNGEEGTREKSAQLNRAGDESPSGGSETAGANGRTEVKSDKNSDEREQGEVLKQRTTDGSKQAVKPKGRKSTEAQVDSPEVSASKVDKQDGAPEEVVKEDTEDIGKNSSGNHKVKRLYIVEEEYDPECISCSDGLVTNNIGETESNNWNTVRRRDGQSRVRRYIVEEEIIEEAACEEQEADDSDEITRLMQ
ncbi:uncharacterized protein LOC126109382 isoform X1 [Schistocerca cancellata]|uniref:uncharacterized protein LOC126109382 isoform X1 n=1 Tax=Schistocerca cancellata TaxID=274614 RepID=UPI002118F200|nr:uncharacterized protein LOC126109382 isoform X1 [Schistocerca cancellata]